MWPNILLFSSEVAVQVAETGVEAHFAWYKTVDEGRRLHGFVRAVSNPRKQFKIFSDPNSEHFRTYDYSFILEQKTYDLRPTLLKSNWTKANIPEKKEAVVTSCCLLARKIIWLFNLAKQFAALPKLQVNLLLAPALASGQSFQKEKVEVKEKEQEGKGRKLPIFVNTSPIKCKVTKKTKSEFALDGLSKYCDKEAVCCLKYGGIPLEVYYPLISFLPPLPNPLPSADPPYLSNIERLAASQPFSGFESWSRLSDLTGKEQNQNPKFQILEKQAPPVCLLHIPESAFATQDVLVFNSSLDFLSKVLKEQRMDTYKKTELQERIAKLVDYACEKGTKTFPNLIAMVRQCCLAEISRTTRGAVDLNKIREEKQETGDVRSKRKEKEKEKEKKKAQEEVSILNSPCIYWACSNNEIKLVKLLLKAKVKVRTACIYTAARNGFTEIVFLLLESGVYCSLLELLECTMFNDHERTAQDVYEWMQFAACGLSAKIPEIYPHQDPKDPFPMPNAAVFEETVKNIISQPWSFWRKYAQTRKSNALKKCRYEIELNPNFHWSQWNYTSRITSYLDGKDHSEDELNLLKSDLEKLEKTKPLWVFLSLGCSALETFCTEGYLAGVRLLINTVKPRIRVQAVYLAAQNGYSDIVVFLLNSGVCCSLFTAVRFANEKGKTETVKEIHKWCLQRKEDYFLPKQYTELETNETKYAECDFRTMVRNVATYPLQVLVSNPKVELVNTGYLNFLICPFCGKYGEGKCEVSCF